MLLCLSAVELDAVGIYYGVCHCRTVVLCSDAYENNRHLRPAVSDMYSAKPPSNFSLLLKCVLSDMGAGECPVSLHYWLHYWSCIFQSDIEQM